MRGMMSQLTFALVLAAGLCLTGCRSSTSTVFTRDEMNLGWSKFDKVAGIPITLKVPTHVKLYVYETHYLESDDLGNNIKKTRYVELPVTIRDFAHEMVYSEKIVMVDFKRPAAGAFNLDVDLTDDQYLKKIQHDVTDNTLNEVNGILKTLSPNGIFRNVSADPVGGRDTLTQVKSVVAVGMFEIDAPDFEAQVNEFLNCHINKGHDAWRASPGVEKVNRVMPENTSDLQLCPNCPCPGFSVGQRHPDWLPSHMPTDGPASVNLEQEPFAVPPSMDGVLPFQSPR